MEDKEEFRNSSQLIELGGSKYEIADGQPNIKGWKVKNAEDETIGEVEELIFDPAALKVRYLVLDLEGNALDLEPRNVLVPIGMADLNESDNLVYLPQVTTDQLTALPVYVSGRIDSTIESEVHSIFGGAGAAGVAGAAKAGIPSGPVVEQDNRNADNLHRDHPAGTPPAAGTHGTGTGTDSIPIIEENLDVDKRTVETGGAHIRTSITEEPVEEDINLREEKVIVERNPASRPASDADFDTFKEGEIEIKEHTEVPVVSKSADVVEEVTIHKEVEEHDEIIKDTVHRTDVEVDEIRPDEKNRGTNQDDDSYLDEEARRRKRRIDPDADDPAL